jgi:hypothetical protein
MSSRLLDNAITIMSTQLQVAQRIGSSVLAAWLARINVFSCLV